MKIKDYHIHININSISLKTSNKLEQIGYLSDPFDDKYNPYSPNFHYSYECKNKNIANKIYKMGLDTIMVDDDFEGFIEAETILEENSFEYNYKFIETIKFPTLNYNMITPKKNDVKKADIHIKRKLTDQNDKLDLILTKHGFYKIKTPRNHIYTLQFKEHSLGKEYFKELDKYFSVNGGIKQMNYEIVSKIIRKPKNFTMAPYAVRNVI